MALSCSLGLTLNNEFGKNGGRCEAVLFLRLAQDCKCLRIDRVIGVLNCSYSISYLQLCARQKLRSRELRLAELIFQHPA